MRASEFRRPAGVLVLIVLGVLLVILGLPAGLALMTDPSGEGVGLPSDMLDDLPVDDYLLVGVFLVVVYGILPMILVYGLWSRPKWNWTDPISKLTGEHWSWTGTLVLGAAQILWIAVQSVYLGFGDVFQWIILLNGIGMIGLPLVPSVRRFFAEPRET
jgi:hypothetical protein